MKYDDLRDAMLAHLVDVERAKETLARLGKRTGSGYRLFIGNRGAVGITNMVFVGNVSFDMIDGSIAMHEANGSRVFVQAQDQTGVWPYYDTDKGGFQ